MIWSILALLGMGLGGIALLRRCTPWLTTLETIAYGLPLGTVVATLVLLVLAIPLGMSAALVVGLSLCGLLVAIAIWPERQSWLAAKRAELRALSWGKVASLLRERVGVFPLLLLGAFTLRWVWAWKDALVYTPAGLVARQLNVWSDWALHLGDVVAFAYGDNFPPQNPRFAGTPYPYHYLADLTAAAMTRLGLDPAYALCLHNFLFSAVLALGLFAFARRITGDNLAGGFSLLLFLLGGGLGWLNTLREINNSHDFWGTLLNRAWDFKVHQAGQFRWENQYDSLISIQRGYLYGLPLAFLGLTLLMRGIEDRDWRLFLGGGGVFGLLPFAHQSTLLAMALVTPFLFLLRPMRQWIAFFGAWVLVAVPQLYLQLGGGRGATAGARWAINWITPPDPFPWYWLKNLGLFLPLLILALGTRRLIPPIGLRALWAFMPLFAIFNVYIFQPWDGDNIKLLLFWFLAVAILVGALLARTWREQRAPVARFLLATAILTMILSGLLLNLYQLTTKDRYTMITTEEIAVAEQIRAKTPPQAVFASGLQHNNPIHVLGARRVMVGFNGWLWTQAIDASGRERDLRTIFAYGPNTPELLKRYQISYVVVGPAERDGLKANEAAFQSRYPLIISTQHYHIYQVAGVASP